MMRYQDYVIKDGKFVGQFEEMYRQSGEIPWQQDQMANQIFSEISVTILKHMKERYSFASVADIGCGLGYFTNRVSKEVLSQGDEVSGYDISRSAVDKAKGNFPHLEFEALDITKPLRQDLCNRFKLVICKECHWYVLDSLKAFRENIIKISSEYVYIVQTFPESSCFLGDDVFANPEAIRVFWEQHCRIIFSCKEEDNKYGNRPLIHLFMRKIKK